MKHIPTLDGWRGIAVLMVLFDHITWGLARSYPRAWMDTGRHGVALFFVLSGYLITSNLLSQPINLKKFYVRRFFRLMPTAWLFLATMLLLDWGYGIHLTSWSEVRGCLLFYRNFQAYAPGGGSGVACHFWSLSIEEHFYLVWPVLLILFGVRRCRWFAFAGAVAIAAYRYAHWNRYEKVPLPTPTEVRADSILVGCLLALLLFDPSIRERAIHLSKLLAVPAAAGFFYGIYTCHLLQPLWESAAIAVLLAFTSLHPRAFPGRIPDWKPLAWLGTVSYSIYVWQELFMQFPRGIPLAVSLIIGLPTVVLVSYSFIEVPLRGLGRRLAENLVAPPAPSVPEPAAG